MTALISAAEEDPHAPGHTWVTNDEGWEVLAAALLLDRRIHRPKVTRALMLFDRQRPVCRAHDLSPKKNTGGGLISCSIGVVDG